LLLSFYSTEQALFVLLSDACTHPRHPMTR
jgi:hypothetical protein